MVKSRWWLAAAVVATLGLSAGAAQARHDEVQWSVTIGSPSMPQVVVPQVVVPRPVYAAPPAYRAPAPVYQPRGHYRQPMRWDDDGDGIPNRYDRLYNPVWDVDGDGIPNRHDARHDARYGPRYSPRWDRDGDRVPNRYDRHDHNPWLR
jgi:hypothetical protein